MYRPTYITEWDSIFHVLAGMPDKLVDDFLQRNGFRRIDGYRAYYNGHVVVSLVDASEIWSAPGWRIAGQAPDHFFVLYRSNTNWKSASL